MIHSSHDIDQLLKRYYDGATTPDEGSILYLAPLQEQPGSPYYVDRMLLETILQRAATEARNAAPALTPHWWAWVRRHTVAVIVLLIGGVGVSVLQWGRSSRQTELSLRNGQPIPQGRVDEYTLAAFTRLGDCMQLCSEQNDEIGELSGRLQDSHQSLMEKIPFVAGDGQTLTGG